MKKKFQKLKNSPWFKRLTNKYVLSILGFIIWMLFVDGNSWIIQWELSSDINELKEDIEYYQAEIKKDKQSLQELSSNPELLEKFAREQFLMKKEGEQIYIIQDETK